METNGKAVFLRDATGLVRSWSWTDAYMYSCLALPVGLWSVIEIGTLSYSFPGADPFLGAAISTLLLVPQSIVYAMLASSMPRAGGDYVYQSRILNPFLSYVVVGLFLIGNAWFIPYTWPTIAGAAIAPLLARISIATGNTGLLSLAGWMATNPLAVLIFSLFPVVTWEWIVNAFGLKFYGRFNKYFFIIAIVASFFAFGILASTSHDQFVSAYNSFAVSLGQSPNFYQSVITQARQAGFTPDYSFSLGQTVCTVAGWAGVIGFMGYYVSLCGEIKRADQLASQIKIAVGSLLTCGIGAACLAGLVTLMVGKEFDAAANYLSFIGQWPLILPPSAGAFLMVIPGMAAPIIAFIFFNGWTWMNYVDTMPYNTRSTMVMAFDRMLPAKMADVNEKFHIPLFNLNVWTTVLVVLCLIYYLYPASSSWFLLATIEASAMMICTALSGAIFPFRQSTKDMYNSSPASKYKLAGIPLITLLGVWSIIVWVFIDSLYFLVPGLGVAGTNLIPTLMFFAVIIGTFAAMYVGFYYYNKSKGIDVSLAFKQVPPE